MTLVTWIAEQSEPVILERWKEIEVERGRPNMITNNES